MSKKPALLYKTLVVSFIICFMLLSPSTLAITKEYINHPPNAPKIVGSHPRPRITDSYSGNNQLPIGFPPTRYWNITTTDPDGDDIYLEIDWDDGTYEDWFGPFHSGEKVPVNHTYSKLGIYPIKARAKDTYGAIGPWGTEQIPIGDNNPPERPIGSGPTSGKSGIKYDFQFVSIDPDEDNISYYIDWGDDTNEEWGPYPSGAPIAASHAWYEKGNYLIRCKATDIYGAESEWLEHIFWVDKSRDSEITQILMRLFERFPFLEVFLRTMNLLR